MALPQISVVTVWLTSERLYVLAVAGLSTDLLADADQSLSGFSVTDMIRLHKRIDALQEVVRSLQANAEHSESRPAPAPHQHSTSEIAALDDSLANPQVYPVQRQRNLCGFLSQQGGGKQLYVGPSFWAHMCNDSAGIDDLLGSQARYLIPRVEHEFSISGMLDQQAGSERACSLDSTFQVEGTMRQQNEERPNSASPKLHFYGDLFAHPPAFSREQEVTSKVVVSSAEHLLHQLPSKVAFDFLFEGYTRGYHPIIPVIYAKGFKQRVDELYRSLSSENMPTGTPTGLLALLYAVCFGGSVAVPASMEVMANMGCATPIELSLRLQDLGIQALRYSNFPRTPTVESLTAYVILQGTWMRQEEPLSCTAFVGLAVRVATVLGLHRDPTHLHISSRIEAEIRRRVWWHLVHIDTIIALAAGLPPVIALETWNVRKISDLTEESMITPAGIEHDELHTDINQDAARCSMECVPIMSIIGTLVGGKHEAPLVLRRYLHDLFDAENLSSSSSTNCLQQLQELVRDLHTRANRISTVSNKTPSSIPVSNLSPSSGLTFVEDNGILSRWGRVYLSTLSDWLFALAGSTAVKSGLRETSPDLHNYLLDKCRSYVLKCASIAACTQFDRFHWAWPGNHQPIHALATLLVDLIQYPNSGNAEKYREAVSIVFAMLGPNGGLLPESSLDAPAPRPLTEGGEELWNFIRRLRSKAWRCADIDPGIVWTRKYAVHWLNNLLAEGNITFPQETDSETLPISQMASLNQEQAETTGTSPLSTWRQGMDDFDFNTPLPDQSFLANFWNELQ